LAGVTFLDPFEDSEKMVQRIRRAKLVIADAMHAAIVADALRVRGFPWRFSTKQHLQVAGLDAKPWPALRAVYLALRARSRR